MQHAEGTDDGIETRIGVAEIFRIADFVPGAGEAPPGFLDHVLGDIGAGCVETTMASFSGDVTGPACHVQQAQPAAWD